MAKRISKSSQQKLEGLHEIMINKGIYAEKALKMNVREFNKAFGKNIKTKKSLKGAKYNIESLRKHLKTVLDYKFKKRGIKWEKHQNAIKKLSNQLLKRKGSGGEPPKKPPKIDVKLNIVNHRKYYTYTIKSFRALKEFVDRIHGSRYSPQAGGMFFDSDRSSHTLKELEQLVNIYENFDYGEEIKIETKLKRTKKTRRKSTRRKRRK